MENKPRKWWLAGLLSLIEPGLGQIYNGQLGKGVAFMLLPTLMLPLYMLALDSRYVLIYLGSMIAVAALYYVIVVRDAIVTAGRLSSWYELKWVNKGIVYLLAVILCTLYTTSIRYAIRYNYVQAFKIPAASMEPTMLIGDHILVDRRPSAQAPRPGDVVVFEYPEDPSKDFIKRAVAVGGDTVAIRDKELYVNGKLVKEPYAVHKEPGLIPAAENPRDNFGPATVPPGSFFVLGDNRDRSYDSRFWGFVDKSKVKGTARNIYWSWDRGNNTVRWDRIGMKIR